MPSVLQSTSLSHPCKYLRPGRGLSGLLHGGAFIIHESPMASSIGGISGAERIADDVDHSVPHRSPPPIPSIAYDSTHAGASPQHLQEPGKPGGGYASESGSFKSNVSERRRGSLGSLLRRTSSHNSALRRQQEQQSEDVPPVPATRIAQVAQAHQTQNGGRISTSGSRKGSTEGRTMLRKSSKLKAAQEAERLEQERLARQRAPPPRLPTHSTLPSIDSFGGENNTNNNGTTNFSRPGYNMPASNSNNSSSPAYAVRGGQASVSAPPTGKTNGEYVDGSGVARHESMTHRGRYSYASSTVPVNMSSPRRIRRRKDPTPFK